MLITAVTSRQTAAAILKTDFNYFAEKFWLPR